MIFFIESAKAVQESARKKIKKRQNVNIERRGGGGVKGILYINDNIVAKDICRLCAQKL